jgi:colicin import membrane protein
MREAIQDEMQAELEAAEASFTPAVAPEAVMAEHFLEVFKQGAEVTLAKIAKFKADYAGLTIAGVEDKRGYEMVRAARIHVKQHRTAVERVRKAENEEHQAQIKKNNAAAKHLEALLEEIEEPLEAEEKRYDAEVKALKEAAQREKDAKLQRRIDALTAVGHPVHVGELATMGDTTFAMVLQTATETWELKEKERLAAEAALAEKRAEEERKAKEEQEAKAAAEKAERERLAAEGARLEAERAAFRKEQEAFEAQRRAQEQADRDKRIAEEAAERAKAKAAQEAYLTEQRRQAQEEADARAVAEAAQREQARKEARPDADKLLALAETLRGTAFPKLTTAEGQKVITETATLIAKVIKYVEDKAAALSPRMMA